MSLHERIARTLGWSLRDVTGMSLIMLRELVRDLNPELAREITSGIRSGKYILEPPPPLPLWHASEEIRLIVGGRRRKPLESFRARTREEAEHMARSRWPHARTVHVRGEGEPEEEDAPALLPVRQPKPKGARKPRAPGAAPRARKQETYQAAKMRLLSELGARGWTVRADLKFPWAKHPRIQSRVNFKAQAVYLGDHSLWIDIRGMSVEDFVKDVAHAENVRNRR